MTSPIRVGIIGTGFGARVHLPAMAALPGVLIAGLADSGSGRAASFAPPGVAAFQGWRAIVEAPDIDAVVVALAPPAHHAIVVAALGAGKHVLCEKPFGMNAAEALAMTQAAARAGKVGAIGFQFRYEPHLRALSAALRTGQIGALQRVELKWLHPGRASPSVPWSWQNDAAAGGGMINALASHVVDLFAWLAGSAVGRVVSSRSAILVPYRPDAGGVSRAVTAEDWAQGDLRLKNGVSATFEISNSIPDGQGMEIVAIGEKGRFRCCQRPPFRPQDATLQFEPPQGAVFPLPIPGHAGNAGADMRLAAVRLLAEAFLKGVRRLPSDVPDFQAGLSMRKILDELQQGARVSGDQDER
jgi:predicted dehydrogenase